MENDIENHTVTPEENLFFSYSTLLGYLRDDYLGIQRVKLSSRI